MMASSRKCATTAANPGLPRVAILFQRFGPYHIARLNAATRHMTVIGIELSGTDRTYPWAGTAGTEAFSRHVVSPDIDAEGVLGMVRKVWTALANARPQTVAIAGWSHPAAMAALLWCASTGTPAIVMSDSAETDEIRHRWREAVKRRIVALYGAALVGGAPHRRYLTTLSMPERHILDGLDVVDNTHFSVGAGLARQKDASLRALHGLPDRYFMTSCRMIAKKNLFTVLDAYRDYRSQVGAAAWDLVMLGEGRLASELRNYAVQLGLTGHVHMPGFRQYDELPVFYGLAAAFILASTTEQWGLVVNEAMAAGVPVLVSSRCGCREDILQPGISGYLFDPDDPRQLSLSMQAVGADSGKAARMALAGQNVIAEWSPDRFARNLRRAVDHGMASRRRPHPAGLLLAGALLFKRERSDD